MNLDWNEHATTPMARIFALYERMHTNHQNGIIKDFHPFTLAAKANQEDYPTYCKIIRMNDKDHNKWFDSMNKEMEGLYQKGTYEFIDQAEAEKTGSKIIPIM